MIAAVHEGAADIGLAAACAALGLVLGLGIAVFTDVAVAFN